MEGFYNTHCLWGTFLTPQLGMRYTYPKGGVHPFVGLGVDMSILVSSKSNNEYSVIKSGGYPGYYAELELDIPLSKKKHALNVRLQFKNIRSVEEKVNFAYGWTGVIGYAFQAR